MKIRNVRRGMVALVIMLFVALQGQDAPANNLRVTNVVMSAGDVGYTDVKFDVSWDNSWKTSWLETGVTPNITVTNWDAAWIFVKYRVATNGAIWQHASLSTNNSEHVSPAAATINVGLSTNTSGTNFGCGVFLYRSAEGAGSWTNNNVKLRWNYSRDGVATTARVDVSVQAIEMVYVPQGSFKVGDGATDKGQFCSNTTGTVAFQITNDNYTITLGGGAAGSLGNNNRTGMYTLDDFNNTTATNLPASFPKGYNAFYCMKYEISQGQWVGFFNMLTDSQKTTAGRDITAGVYHDSNGTGKASDAEVNRNTVSWIGIGNDATCTTPDRACNFLSWADGAAYADWAGLRPMTELEFEKACRGPLNAVAGEYAWGNTTITAITGFSGTDGSETATPANANCCCIYSISGPVRCGIFATSTSGRAAAGATYWGIMEMSGNLWERPVTVGAGAGRLFTGALGDGKLELVNGVADAANWPGTSASGAGFRGGDCTTAIQFHRVSDRIYVNLPLTIRRWDFGFRAVRQASSVVP